MKRNEFEKCLKRQGYTLIRSNAHHIWSNGTHSIAVPNHKEINRMIARRLLKEMNYPESINEVNYYVEKV